MRHLCVGLSLFAAFGCPPPESRTGDTPAGTPTDPVEVCAHVGDVCRYDGSQLGVCNKAEAGKSCPAPGPCFTCVSQH